MKINNIFFFLFMLAAALVLTTCDAFGTIIGTVRPHTVEVYLDSDRSAGSGRSASSARSAQDSEKNRIEFYVTNLLLTSDSMDGGGWLIGVFETSGTQGRYNNIGQRQKALS
jgi:hypothetical protein